MKYILRAPRGKKIAADRVTLLRAMVGVTVHEVSPKMVLVEGDFDTLETVATAEGWYLFTEEYYHVSRSIAKPNYISGSVAKTSAGADRLARLRGAEHAAELYLSLVIKGVEDGVVAEEDVSGGRWTGCNDYEALDQALRVNADFRAAFALRAHVNSFRHRLWAMAVEMDQVRAFKALGKEVENENEGPVSGTARPLSELKEEFSKLKELASLLYL